MHRPIMLDALAEPIAWLLRMFAGVVGRTLVGVG